MTPRGLLLRFFSVSSLVSAVFIFMHVKAMITVARLRNNKVFRPWIGFLWNKSTKIRISGSFLFLGNGIFIKHWLTYFVVDLKYI